MNIITNDMLIVGNFYHCVDRKSQAHDILKCHSKQGQKCLGHNAIWATDMNNQALDRYMIFDVIIPSEIKQMVTNPQSCTTVAER